MFLIADAKIEIKTVKWCMEMGEMQMMGFRCRDKWLYNVLGGEILLAIVTS